ncbi:MAG: hypothetical protein MUP17_06740 [candidate division Zixibacteria bacterium]|nr:hypothetical protein [candidate division Zixibacteria bacterium]
MRSFEPLNLELLNLSFMYQDIDEQVEVIALFQKGKILPLKFRWKGKTYKILRLENKWKSDLGEKRCWHFSVTDSASNFFQLTYNEEYQTWSLSKLWVE